MKTSIRTAAAMAILGYSSTSLAQLYTYDVESMSATELNFMGAFAAEANDVNQYVEIVGWANYNQLTPRAVLYRNGSSYWVTDDGGQNLSYAQGINNNAEVVGYYRDANATEYSAFYWNDSSSSMETLSGNVHNAWATAINDNGKIAGRYHAYLQYCNGLPDLPVTWDSGYSPYNVLFCLAPGGGGLAVEDINDSGTVVGSEYTYPDILSQAFRWNGTKTVVPKPAGTCQTFANGVNESGAVAGRTEDCDGFTPRAFYWNGISSVSISLGTLPGGGKSDARDVNDDKIVAGWSEQQVWTSLSTSVIRQRAFVWNASFGMKALPLPTGFPSSTTHCRANALNNRNPFNGGYMHVVGYCINPLNNKRPVLWTLKVSKKPMPPIPPPL